MVSIRFIFIGILFLLAPLVSQADDPKRCEEGLLNPTIKGKQYGPIQGPDGDTFLLETFSKKGIPIVLFRYLNPSFSLSEDKKTLIESLLKKGSRSIPWDQLNATTEEHRVNCHSFALMYSDIDFLRSGYWVNSLISYEFTFGFNPFLEILKMYFSPLIQFDLRPEDFLGSEYLLGEIKNFKPGDIVVFIDENQNIIHSGVLINSPHDPNSLQILHKLGPGPVLISPLNHVQDIYRFSNIAIWRKST